jgi:condensin complex subunit 1
MGVVGAVADDQEAEYIRNICENDIVTGESLLAALRYVSALFIKLV